MKKTRSPVRCASQSANATPDRAGSSGPSNHEASECAPARHPRGWLARAVAGVSTSVVALFALGVAPAWLAAAEWAQTAKLLASDGDFVDYFGYAVAVDGDRIAVATPWDDEVTGDAGAAYVFERDGEGRWFEAAKLTAPDAEGCCWYLGGSVGLSGDTLVATANGADPVGLDETGAAYVFERDESGVWRPAKKLKSPDGRGLNWGSSVAIAGNNLVVGAVFEGVFPDAGAAYVFERDAGGRGNWGPVAKLKASDGESDDRFGGAAALDADRLVVGAVNDDDRSGNAGAAYVFDLDENGEWIESAKLTASDGDLDDNLGWSIDVDGDTVVVGAWADEDAGNASGSAYVFERDERGVWQEVMKLKASDLELGDRFGSSVGIDQGIVIVGAYSKDNDEVGTGAGAAYIFERDQGGPGNWGEAAKLTAARPMAGDNFGFSVAISETHAVAGSRHDDVGALDAGAAYVFARVDPTLAVTGTCPGPVGLVLSGATPNLPVALLGAASEGSAIVPSGRCAGTDVGLSAPNILTIRRADQDGELSLVRMLGPRACGDFLQVLDGFTCEVSEVEQLP